jgi:hypothetical protein
MRISKEQKGFKIVDYIKIYYNKKRRLSKLKFIIIQADNKKIAIYKILPNLNCNFY